MQDMTCKILEFLIFRVDRELLTDTHKAQACNKAAMAYLVLQSVCVGKRGYRRAASYP